MKPGRQLSSPVHLTVGRLLALVLGLAAVASAVAFLAQRQGEEALRTYSREQVNAQAWRDYDQRAQQRAERIQACGRSTADRVTDAHGWRAAQLARTRAWEHATCRKATASALEGAAARGDLDAAAALSYDEDASSHEERAGLADHPIDPGEPLKAVLASTAPLRRAFCEDAIAAVAAPTVPRPASVPDPRAS